MVTIDLILENQIPPLPPLPPKREEKRKKEKKGKEKSHIKIFFTSMYTYLHNFSLQQREINNL